MYLSLACILDFFLLCTSDLMIHRIVDLNVLSLPSGNLSNASFLVGPRGTSLVAPGSALKCLHDDSIIIILLVAPSRLLYPFGIFHMSAVVGRALTRDQENHKQILSQRWLRHPDPRYSTSSTTSAPGTYPFAIAIAFTQDAFEGNR